jgi:titin
VSGNLPDVPVSAVKVDTRTSPATLYAATDTGVFWSQDSGVTWSAAASGIPATIITDVLIDTAGDTLVASTHGRGMYTTPLPSTPPTAAVATPAGAKAGDVVTITGTDLEYTRGVTVNGRSVAFGIDSATSIHFTVPLAATSGPIVVTTTGGSATAATSYTVTPTVPLPPTTPTATAYNGQVVLAWTAPAAGASTITGYQVQRSTNGIAWTTLTSAAPLTRTYTATGLTNGTTYRFRVAAHNASGWGDFSPAVSVAPKTVPTVPGTPTATAYNGQVVLVWGAPSSAGSKPITTYRIQRSTNGVAWTTVTSTAPLTRTYTAVGLVNGTTYQFRVSALNAVGQSNWSAVVKSAPKAVPTAPRSPLATVASGKVTLKWTAPSSPGSKPITAYRIQRSTNGVTWTTITSSAPLSRVFVAGGLVNNTTYRFRIAAISSLGASNWSNVVTAKPHA